MPTPNDIIGEEECGCSAGGGAQRHLVVAGRAHMWQKLGGGCCGRILELNTPTWKEVAGHVAVIGRHCDGGARMREAKEREIATGTDKQRRQTEIEDKQTDGLFESKIWSTYPL